MQATPVLYSFRRCPYAMRARMALAYAGITVTLREVVLKDKPEAMLAISPKGSVPVLQLPDATVIDESSDIMHWAIDQHDPMHWRSPPVSGTIDGWLAANDGEFKQQLDRYKYADRHPDHPAEHYRDNTHPHLAKLDAILAEWPWLHGEKMGFIDVALMPFIRQFAMVDRGWFDRGPYPSLSAWLQRWLDEPLFLSVMDKYPQWQPDHTPCVVTWKR